jgi:hypothetical protein
MNPELTDYFLALQINRKGIDEKAYQGWLAKEAAAHRDSQANGVNAIRQFSRRSFDRLVRQVIGGKSESARAAEEAIVSYR